MQFNNVSLVIAAIILILIVFVYNKNSKGESLCSSPLVAGVPSFVPSVCNTYCPLVGGDVEKTCSKACGCKPIYLDNLEFEVRDNTLSSHMRTVGNQSYMSLDKCSNSRCFNCPKNAPQRPGSMYDIADSYIRMMPAPYRILLIHNPDCSKHKLAMLFDEVADHASQHAAKGLISFEKYRDDKTMAKNLGALPAIVKVRRNGEVMRYDKGTTFGELYDWVMNEALLDVSKYP